MMNNTEPGGEPELVKGKCSCFLVDTRHDEQHRTWGEPELVKGKRSCFLVDTRHVTRCQSR